jgi:hypothetical protein
MRIVYVATVEVATRQLVPLDEDTSKTLVDSRPTLAMSSNGWVEVRMTFHATGLAHACTKAAAIARAATGAEALACEVMTECEYEDRQGLPRGSISGGRHAALAETSEPPEWALPRQSTQAWQLPHKEPAEPQRGRHTA